MIGIDDFSVKPYRIHLIIDRQWLGTGSHQDGQSMFPVSPGIGEDLKVNGPDHSVPSRSNGNVKPHGMTGESRLKDLFPGIDQFGRPPGLLGHCRYKELTMHGLLAPKAAADPGFDYPHILAGDIQGIADNPPGMVLMYFTVGCLLPYMN
jgi:hypothetical protein